MTGNSRLKLLYYTVIENWDLSSLDLTGQTFKSLLKQSKKKPEDKKSKKRTS